MKLLAIISIMIMQLTYGMDAIDKQLDDWIVRNQSKIVQARTTIKEVQKMRDRYAQPNGLNGYSPKKSDEDGNTYLHILAAITTKETYIQLFSQSSNPSATNKLGITPLIMGICANNPVASSAFKVIDPKLFTQEVNGFMSSEWATIVYADLMAKTDEEFDIYLKMGLVKGLIAENKKALLQDQVT